MVLKNVLVFTLTLAMSTPAIAQTFEDELLIEAETAIADSEAALQEAADSKKIAKEEQKRTKVVVKKAEREINHARKVEEEAKKRIAAAESDRAKAIQDSEKAKLATEDAKLRIDTAKEEIARVKLQVEEANANRALALEKKEQVDDQLAEVKQELKNLQTKLANVQREELTAIKSLQRAEEKMKRLQEKAALSFKGAEKDVKAFLASVATQRESLNDIAKRLDELEVEVETDQSFSEQQSKLQAASEMGQSVQQKSLTKLAKVLTDGCHVRSNPTTQAQVVGTSKQGEKLRIRPHNEEWYTVVYDGQKAFMGRGCFQTN